MESLIYLKKTTSTNEKILEFPELENLPFLGLYTFNQTKGKGQYGNSWEAPENQNISYTLAIRKEYFSNPSQVFNFRTALIFRNFLANLTKSEVKIKWPNDLIMKGKKVAGILTEAQKVNSIPYIIIGIGINVLQEDFKNLPYAASLFSQSKKKFDLEKTAVDLHTYLTENLKKKLSNKEILDAFNKHLFRKDQISVFEKKGVRQNGIIRFADEEGFLHIELENSGLQKFFHKEITLLY